MKTCPECKGGGWVNHEYLDDGTMEECWHCAGAGKVDDNNNLLDSKIRETMRKQKVGHDSHTT